MELNERKLDMDMNIDSKYFKPVYMIQTSDSFIFDIDENHQNGSIEVFTTEPDQAEAFYSYLQRGNYSFSKLLEKINELFGKEIKVSVCVFGTEYSRLNIKGTSLEQYKTKGENLAIIKADTYFAKIVSKRPYSKVTLEATDKILSIWEGPERLNYQRIYNLLGDFISVAIAAIRRGKSYFYLKNGSIKKMLKLDVERQDFQDTLAVFEKESFDNEADFRQNFCFYKLSYLYVDSASLQSKILRIEGETVKLRHEWMTKTRAGEDVLWVCNMDQEGAECSVVPFGINVDYTIFARGNASEFENKGLEPDSKIHVPLNVFFSGDLFAMITISSPKFDIPEKVAGQLCEMYKTLEPYLGDKEGAVPFDISSIFE